MTTVAKPNWVQAVIWPAGGIIVIVFILAMMLNTPVAFDRIQATVVRLGPYNGEYTVGTNAFVELDDGRVVVVFYDQRAKVPAPNSQITITRAKRRFFGEKFAP